MNTELLASILSCLVTLTVCLINNASVRHQVEAKHQETISLITYRLEQLEKSVGKHNDLIDRMYKVETAVQVHEERLNAIEKGVAK